MIVGLVQLSWVNGEAYDQIEITRDGASLTLVGGGITSVLDDTVGAGIHEYTVTPRIDGLDGATVICSATIVPEPVNTLVCAGGALEATLSWILGEIYDEIEVRRDGTPILLLLGSATTATDVTATVGSHTYSVVGRVGGVDASPQNCVVTVVPPPVVALACSGGAGTATLYWVNGMAYASIEVRRDGLLVAALPGADVGYTDVSPPIGAVTYTVLGRTAGLGSTESPCSITVALAPILDFTCPTIGDTIAMTWSPGATYDAIELRRDGALIATLSGTDASYLDLLAQGGTHLYSLIPSLGGTSATESTCTGSMNPAPVTALSATIVDPCSCQALLTWSNREPYDSLEVRLDGVLTATVAGTDTSLALTLPSNGTFDLCVRPITDAMAGTDECALVTCAPVLAEPIGTLICLVDDPTCTATVTWGSHPTAASIEVRLDGVLVASLAGTQTLASVNLVGTSAQTIEVSGVSICGDPLPASTCSVDCQPPVQFVRGDANGDGSYNISDPIVTLIHLFGSGSVACTSALDTNDDELVDLSDVISSLDGIFGLGGLPGVPFPGCGSDPTTGPLDCVAVPLCP